MYNFKKVIAFTAAGAVLGVSSLTVPFSVFADEAETEISTVSETETTSVTESEEPTETSSDETIEYEKAPDSSYNFEYDDTNGTAKLANYKGSVENLILPEKVEKDGKEYTVSAIKYYAFKNNQTIKNVIVPKTYKTIEKWAFWGCSNLKTIELSEGIEEMGQSIFNMCYSLESIVIPESVTVLKNKLFSNCTSLKKAVIKCKVNVVGMYMFDGCRNLEEVVLPDGITEFQTNCFNDCYSLKEIKIPDTVTVIGDNAFSECNSIDFVKIPDSVKTIGKNAFYRCGISIDNFNYEKINKFLMVADKGTAAEEYAKENYFDMKSETVSDKGPYFMTTETYEKYLKSLEEYESREENPPTQKFVNYGDVNSDNSVDSKDAVQILIDYAKRLADLPSDFNEDQREAADVNCDGEVNSTDAVIVLRYYSNQMVGSFSGTVKEFVEKTIKQQ